VPQPLSFCVAPAIGVVRCGPSIYRRSTPPAPTTTYPEGVRLTCGPRSLHRGVFAPGLAGRGQKFAIGRGGEVLRKFCKKFEGPYLRRDRRFAKVCEPVFRFVDYRLPTLAYQSHLKWRHVLGLEIGQRRTIF
jgi:hypothetical protein